MSDLQRPQCELCPGRKGWHAGWRKGCPRNKRSPSDHFVSLPFGLPLPGMH